VEDVELSSALHARARAFVAAFERRSGSPEPFDSLACDIARFQADHVQGFARLCHARGIDPASLVRADDIPAVPTEAFKMTRVAAFEPAAACAIFRTSGTTLGARGEHTFRDLATYDAAALASGRAWLARDLDRRVPVLVLGPSPEEAPDSSLVHMCDAFVRAFGSPDSAWLVENGVIDLTRFDERVVYAEARGDNVLLLGTSFAFVHFLDALGDAMFRLPRGSRVMQTGGYKGKSREVPKDALVRELARVLAVDPRAIVAEYGMTELSSQFYEKTIADAAARPGVYAEPPWARVVPVDPETGQPADEGEAGIAKILDLANVDSAVAVLAQDLVRRVPGGFELLGRASGAPPRGCSIAMDEILGASRGTSAIEFVPCSLRSRAARD
jgi:hypothetical protein